MMRRAAVTVALLLSAVPVRGDGEAIELVYEFAPGEAAAAADVLARRLELLGIADARVKPLDDGKRVTVRHAAADRADEVREVTSRVGHIEMRRVVEPTTPGYERHKKDFDTALARGVEPAKACDISPSTMVRYERDRWPGGLRWYRNARASEALKEDWVLCEVDAQGITEESFERVTLNTAAEPPHDRRAVHLDLKESCEDAMERLTHLAENEEVRLAVIVDGEVIQAPKLLVPLRRNAEVSFRTEPEARAFAAAVGGGTLPRKPKLVDEPAVER